MQHFKIPRSIAAITIFGLSAMFSQSAFAHHHSWYRSREWHRHEGGGHASPALDAKYALPNASLTPGAINPNVTQANIHRTICASGYSKSIRPPESYTEPLKRKDMGLYGYSDRRLGDYELDHLVSLELGGSPTSPKNLWPQPHNVQGGWGSYAKDRLENRLHEMVCGGQISLAQAQYDIAHNWVETYKKYLGANPKNTPQAWMKKDRRW